MDIALGIGIFFIIFYLVIRELQIWSILTQNDFDYKINKTYDKLNEIENDISLIKENKQYCDNCIYYKKCNGDIK